MWILSYPVKAGLYLSVHDFIVWGSVILRKWNSWHDTYRILQLLKLYLFLYVTLIPIFAEAPCFRYSATVQWIFLSWLHWISIYSDSEDHKYLLSILCRVLHISMCNICHCIFKFINETWHGLSVSTQLSPTLQQLWGSLSKLASLLVHKNTERRYYIMYISIFYLNK